MATGMILLLDNQDSFTYNLQDYLLQQQVEVQVLRSDQATLVEIQALPLQGIVLSPGPKRPEDHPLMMQVLQELGHRIPILGICLGLQAIALWAGGKLLHSPEPVHGKTSRIRHFGHPMHQQLPEQFTACRYHSLVAEDLPQVLEVTATTETGTVMSLAHRELPVWAHQFHPEAVLTEDGMQLLANWVQATNCEFVRFSRAE